MRTRMDGVRHKQRNFFSVFMYILRQLKTDARLYIKQRSQSSVHSYETS